VRQHFSEEEVVFLSVSIATINAWNRLGAAFRFAPPIPRKVAAAA
jgi:alkylhydroperoxidase family enzyme